jgi:predicted nuclease of predicted toxin-antitoxin system
VKLLVDMNLSPSWVERLARHGFEAVHWSTIGAATAPDVEILTWADEHHFVVITNDLDFSAILAAGAVAGPSVVQLRTQDPLSEDAVRIVARALEMPELLHPRMADVYREKVGNLCLALEADETRTGAAQAIRALVEAIVART